jgi:hypothetical protein
MAVAETTIPADGVCGETHAHHSEKPNIHMVDADDHIVEIPVAAA